MKKRSGLTILCAFVGAVVFGFIGLVVAGRAKIYAATSSGAVDLTDPNQVSAAWSDPTYDYSLSWGSFTLHGEFWTAVIPLGFATLGIVLAVLLTLRGSK